MIDYSFLDEPLSIEDQMKRAESLWRLGATMEELIEFIRTIRPRSFREWGDAWSILYDQDRFGVIAARKEKRAAYRKKRMQDPGYRAENAMRARIWAALKGRSDRKLFSRMTFTRAELIAHIEAQFVEGMSWDNYGKWHVDHRRPCASFNQADPIQFAECWALDNLQPLWKADNIKKGAKYGEA